MQSQPQFHTEMWKEFISYQILHPLTNLINGLDITFSPCTPEVFCLSKSSYTEMLIFMLFFLILRENFLTFKFLHQDVESGSGGVPLSVVHPCLHDAVCHCHTYNKFMIRSKMARQLFNVAEIKYRCLGNGAHWVRFLNRFGKFIQSLNRISEMFFFTWFLVDKFSPHISAYHLGP